MPLDKVFAALRHESHALTQSHKSKILRLHDAGCAYPQFNDAFKHDSVIAGQIQSLRRIGDGITAEQLVGTQLSPVDNNAILPHYIDGLSIRLSLAEKMGLDPTSPQSALGYKLMRHYYLDEFGTSLTDNSKVYPDWILQACLMYLKQQFESGINKLKQKGMYDPIDIRNYRKIVASFPRGKNSGLPLVVRGKDRLFNDISLAVNAKLSSILLDGTKPEEVFSGLLHHYLVFSRYQRTGRHVPHHNGTQLMDTQYYEPRRRVVNGAPKSLSMALKPLMKWMTVVGLETDVFTQSREVLRDRSKGVVFANDASRFDLRSGGLKLKQAINIIIDLAEHFGMNEPHVRDIAMYESFLPTVATYGYPDSQLYEITEDFLRSGSALTSRAGSVLSLMDDMYVEAHVMGTKDPKVVADFFIAAAPSVIQSDDQAKFYDRIKDGDDRKAKYIASLNVLKDLGKEAEVELPTKFIGYFLTKESLMHSTSPLDNMFFPESFKSNATASMIARYVILKYKDAFSVLDVIKNIMTSPKELALLYDEWHAKMYNQLAGHYSNHPSGAARQFFMTLPKKGASPELISKNLYSDIDEILVLLSKGSAYDFNYALIGLPELNEVLAESESNMDTSFEGLTKAMQDIVKMTGVAKGNESGFRQKVNNSKIEALVKIVTAPDAQSTIAAYHTALPVIARSIKTDAGEAFIGNL